MAGVNDSEVLAAFGVLKTNCVGGGGGAGHDDARALYPVAALINHSCVPNLDPMIQAAGNFGFKVSLRVKRLQCHRRWSNTSNKCLIFFQAQRSIARGEELTIRYSEVQTVIVHTGGKLFFGVKDSVL